METIKQITGFVPLTCPWRAMYDDLVLEVMSFNTAFDETGIAVLGADPPAILHDALLAYQRAYKATLNEERKLHYEQMKKDREAARASR